MCRFGDNVPAAIFTYRSRGCASVPTVIDDITQQLFSDTPGDTLYHYTSLSGLLGIVDTQLLRASDIRYMNDSVELRHTLDLLSSHIRGRIRDGTDQPELLTQLLDWLSSRVTGGPMLFGASFRANGNLLSQWRGYSVHGKGVSLGFAPRDIRQCADRQGFQVARCIYDATVQQSLIERIVDAVETMASTPGVDARETLFEVIEGRLLSIAAVLKHPSFEEEQEWRIVSPVIQRLEEHPIHFREGASMLVPYFAFSLRMEADSTMRLEHVYLGPTSNIDQSLNSLRLYLQRRGVGPRQGISYCQIPYRQR
jgi:hypothetical protein